MKRILFGISLLVAFVGGYSATTVFAFPAAGVYGRGEYNGYITNTHDTAGVDVFNPSYNNGGVMEAFPSYINSAGEFISFVEGKLSGNNQEKSGAAFIIESMLSTPPTAIYRNRPPTAAQKTTWENIIKTAEAGGHIVWRTNFSFTINSYYQGNIGGTSGTNDDAFFDNSDTSAAMLFKDDSGNVKYAIKWQCANPVGNSTTFGALQQPWAATGRTVVTDGNPDTGDTANAITTRPGDTVHFDHYVKNNGPAATGNDNIWYSILDQSNATIKGGQNSGAYSLNQEKLVDNTENIVVPSNAANGTQYCRKVLWSWKNSWGGGDNGTRDGYGAVACATVTADYSLFPTTTVDRTTAQQGDTINFTYTIRNDGDAASPAASCYVKEGATYLTLTMTCPQSFPAHSGPVAVTATPEAVTVTNQAPGSQICRQLFVTPASSAVNNRGSANVCVTIVKTPLVSFLGGDVWAGGGFAAVAPGTCANPAKITTSPSRGLSDGSRAGSGVAYGAFALDKITNFGSASVALVTATGVGDAWTFSNINPSNLGFFGAPQHCINDYASTYASAPTLGAGTIDVGGGTSGAWKITGNPTLHGTMSAGLQKVYYVIGDVTIDADLTYPASYASAADIPSLVIIATGNINVAAGVAQMDGQFITRGTFYTCSPKVEPATISTCTTQLNVNGSVSSTNLDIFRTAGSDGITPATQKVPAEVFNMSPEVYIKNALNQTTQTTITTNNVRELPPRF